MRLKNSKYSQKLAGKSHFIGFSKIDLLPAYEADLLPDNLKGIPCYSFSAVTGDGLRLFIDAMVRGLKEEMANG